MPQRNDNTEISVMEELDPEPSPTGRFSHAREFVLGALLLLGVIGWAGWQWWDQAARQNNYSQGEQAASARHWDEAQSLFASASGYKDADARSAQAAKNVADRNRHYTAAESDLASGHAAEAVKEIEAARNIQPDYREMAAIHERAEAQVYSQAVGGAIALRTQARPPGLYYRTSSGWAWLQGSDIWSQVRSIGDVDRVVYDVAGPDWSPRPTPTPVPDNHVAPPGAPQLEGRLLKVASFAGDKIAYADLSFDPVFYNFYICADHGVVGWSYNSDDASNTVPVALSYPGFSLDFQAYSSPVISTVLLAQPDTTLLDMSLEHNTLLTASWSGTSVRSSNIEVFTSKIDYVSGAVQQSPTLLYSFAGQIGGATLSPDGRYVLLSKRVPNEVRGGEDQSILLFDLQGGQPPVTVATGYTDIVTEGGFYSYQAKVSATFLHEGPNAGKILLIEQGSNSTTGSIRDTRAPQTPLVSVTGQGEGVVAGVREEENGAKLLVYGERSLMGTIRGSTEGTRDDLFFTVYEQGKPPVTTYVPRDINRGRGLFPVDASLVAGNLIYDESDLSVSSTTALRKIDHRIYSIPEGSLGQSNAAPPPVYSTITSSAEALGRMDRWYKGRGLFAYVEANGLHARTYDGKTDIKLESGVEALAEPAKYKGLRSLR